MPPKLFKYTQKDVDLFYTEDIIKNKFNLTRKQVAQTILDTITSHFLESFLKDNKEQGELIEIYAQKNNLERTVILSAHGDSRNHKWYYSDGDKDFLVQSWINNMDGNYKLLILNVCNPGRHEVSSKKSALLLPNEIYSGIRVARGRVQLELFIPGRGYVDSYIVNEEIERMKI